MKEQEKKNGKNMQQLFEICKSNTDKDIENQAIDALRATRLVLIDIISGDAKLSYAKFLDIIGDLKINEPEIKALQNAIALESTLEKIFKDVEKNVNAKAVHELEHIMKVSLGYC